MLEEEDRKIYEQLQPPKTIVCKYGYQKLVAELESDGKSKPGCGSKLVVRTSRGIELAEMLTTTCANSGCNKSISRKQMLQYIEASGGKDYPFTNQGKVLRVATREDVVEQSQLDARKPKIIQFTKALIRELDLAMGLVEVELLLGGDRMIFYYTAENWVDFRELVRRLATEFQTRIEMQQVNAREEARLVADYERCGQYCCCKNFLKVLKPVSMRSAKIQKATLDPAKISGRCGRLMCCLRYEDKTYDDLRKRLPRRQSRVLTDEGLGTVVDTQILTQLALVVFDEGNKRVACPVENLKIVNKQEEEKIKAEALANRPPTPNWVARRQKSTPDRPPQREAKSPSEPRHPRQPEAQKPGPPGPPGSSDRAGPPEVEGTTGESKKKRSRRGRRRRRKPPGSPGEQGGDQPKAPDS